MVNNIYEKISENKAEVKIFGINLHKTIEVNKTNNNNNNKNISIRI